jgi:serine/threonine protein kinase
VVAIIFLPIVYYIYRDFKPQNLLLFNNGKRIKIADLGESRTVTSKSMSEGIGTHFYLSPGIII